MSRDLRARGFKFVGSTICYAFMQATGMVNDHLVDCFRTGSSASPPPLAPAAVDLVGLAGRERHVAVHRQPAAAASLQDEGGAAGPGKAPPSGAVASETPARRDPGRVAGRPHGRVPVEAEVADARPDLPPLLALDIVQPGDGGGEGAEGHGVGSEERRPVAKSRARTAPSKRRIQSVISAAAARGWACGALSPRPDAVNAGGSRYSLAMEPLTLETFGALARERGLRLTEPSWPACFRWWRRVAR